MQLRWCNTCYTTRVQAGLSAITQVETETRNCDLEADGAGRRLDRRRDAIIACADRLFLQQGFDRTTLADVVECAGGSLATIYKLFGSKSGLLEAVMECRATSKDGWLQGIVDAGDPPVKVLEMVGQELLCRFKDPAEVALSRVVIAYSLENPDFARRFHGRTIAMARGHLTRLFARWQDSGYTLNAPPGTLAAIFLGMFVYDLHSQAISHGATPVPAEADIAAKLRVFCIGAGLC
ncbi:TetR/AcrR family transcriptional regulator [Croceibacterium sp. TMG7-5b_MA50]|uniref:TetR/AcrR family transcriptional regulator n=1 Tax=Croceibacterium sp. TMG7-5b_MA50 TaxID=3121290 RepID=UPI0032214709